MPFLFISFVCFLSNYLSVYLSVYQPIYLSICMSFCLSYPNLSNILAEVSNDAQCPT